MTKAKISCSVNMTMSILLVILHSNGGNTLVLLMSSLISEIRVE